jgi:hypothetical protein
LYRKRNFPCYRKRNFPLRTIIFKELEFKNYNLISDRFAGQVNLGEKPFIQSNLYLKMQEGEVVSLKQFLSGYQGEHQSMYIVFLGDLHYGNKHYDQRYLDRAFKFIDKNRKRCRVVLMGDLMEVATKTSVGRSVYEESYPTQRQFEVAVEQFKPYADLVDLVIEGNHEERIIRDTSFEIIQEFCHRLDRFDAYGKFSGVVNYNLASNLTYSLYAWHGATGGTKESSVINGLLGMRERCIAHLYAMGHTHKLLSFNREVRVPAPGSDDLAVIKQMFVNTGTAVGDGGYGEQKGFATNRIGFGAVQLFSDQRKQVFHYIDDLVD